MSKKGILGRVFGGSGVEKGLTGEQPGDEDRLNEANALALLVDAVTSAVVSGGGAAEGQRLRYSRKVARKAFGDERTTKVEATTRQALASIPQGGAGDDSGRLAHHQKAVVVEAVPAMLECRSSTGPTHTAQGFSFLAVHRWLMEQGPLAQGELAGSWYDRSVVAFKLAQEAERSARPEPTGSDRASMRGAGAGVVSDEPPKFDVQARLAEMRAEDEARRNAEASEPSDTERDEPTEGDDEAARFEEARLAVTSEAERAAAGGSVEASAQLTGMGSIDASTEPPDPELVREWHRRFGANFPVPSDIAMIELSFARGAPLSADAAHPSPQVQARIDAARKKADALLAAAEQARRERGVR